MNRLATEPSLYLRQHAENPVHWQPWGEAAWQEANERNVPVLISIGYSSCHWCHVMEHNVFEKPDLAANMNDALVCIKVDREERPDIDMIYMEAVQKMGLGGGWPLNVFCTPDGEPFYGGTYFPPPNWAQVVKEISRAWREQEADLRDTASKFREALQSELHDNTLLEIDLKAQLASGIENLLKQADWTNGGIGSAPKFPLPGKYQFLLKVGAINPRAPAISLLTLKRMCEGGLYDHVGGGFFRYSTDALWFAPHFEKMLYDNGQLVSLLALAQKLSPSVERNGVLEETIDWVEREMTDPTGAFYSSIDADSEGEEGRFYTWPSQELKQLVPDAYPMLEAYFSLTNVGNWENGRNIFAKKHDAPTLMGWSEIKKTLFEARENRIKPTLDTKVVAGWNALMTLGLAQAYQLAGNEKALALAQKNGEFAKQHLINEGVLLHQPDKALEGYLDDYAGWCMAFLALYQTTFNEAWLATANELTQRVLTAFEDPENPLLYYTSNQAEQLLARKKEVNDSVIPSSNAMMASALWKLGLLLENFAYVDRADAMLHSRKATLGPGLAYSTHWGEVAMMSLGSQVEIAIVGPEAYSWATHIQRKCPIDTLLAATPTPSALPMLKGKTPPPNKTGGWLCTRGACQPPVYSFPELEELLNARLTP